MKITEIELFFYCEKRCKEGNPVNPVNPLLKSETDHYRLREWLRCESDKKIKDKRFKKPRLREAGQNCSTFAFV